jgi:hypothetical protein
MPMVAAALMPILFAIGCQPPAPPALPTDAQDACPLSATTFAGWFQSNSPSLNGVVNPANSLLNLNPDCGFYQWSEQMFLWLNSPAPAVYGGGSRIFDSPAFYDVSPPDASGNRTLLAHSSGRFSIFPLRIAKLGPDRLPVILDRSGRLFEARPVNPALKPIVRDPSGNLVEIAHVRVERDRPVFLDQQGNIILAQHASTPLANLDRKEGSGTPIVQKFIVDRFPLFIDPSLAVIDVEQGQAETDSVLEAQTTANGSLVYYATMVNDVYAYFLTGMKDGAITTNPANEFPTTPTDLTNIQTFAAAHGKPSFPDPNALAIEVKSSWVIAASLPNVGNYITMTATIPTYDTTNPQLWKNTGQQTVLLALVGMHVVGSTAGHPEMVWATFEHTGNAPLAAYSYTSTTGTKTVAQDTSPAWLFAASGSANPFNTPHMSFTGPSGTPPNAIQANPTFSISPSNTLRVEPFGVDGSNLFENTEVLSTNNHVLSMLTPGDIRGNYFMTGATWTPFGSNPSGSNQGVGTNKLANSTMETYAQGSNCFSCHQNINNPVPAVPTTQISHIFPGIQPLF